MADNENAGPFISFPDVSWEVEGLWNKSPASWGNLGNPKITVDGTIFLSLKWKKLKLPELIMNDCLLKRNVSKTVHFGILIPDTVNKAKFIHDLLSGKTPKGLEKYEDLKGHVFSLAAMEELMEQEERFDEIRVALARDRKLRSFSSGERRKEYLSYCLSKEPEFLILDNPFDHLDVNSRELLAKKLEELSENIFLIQLATRQSDLLPFIENTKRLDKNGRLVEPKKPASSMETFNFPQMSPMSGLAEGTFLIEFKGVSVKYGDKSILNNIDWRIAQGEFWQLIGPNGSGKSTLLDMITGENAKGYGQELYIFGKKKGSGESIWEIKKRIGYFSPAMLDLFKRTTSAEEMLLSGFFDSIGLYQNPTSLQRKQAFEYLKLGGMEGAAKKSFHELSVGQQRVILILRAMIKQPPLLILDEPTEGMDDRNAALVIKLINQLVLQENITTIMVSHRLEDGLLPTSVYELDPGEHGSIGKVRFQESGGVFGKIKI